MQTVNVCVSQSVCTTYECQSCLGRRRYTMSSARYLVPLGLERYVATFDDEGYERVEALIDGVARGAGARRVQRPPLIMLSYYKYCYVRQNVHSKPSCCAQTAALAASARANVATAKRAPMRTLSTGPNVASAARSARRLSTAPPRHITLTFRACSSLTRALYVSATGLCLLFAHFFSTVFFAARRSAARRCASRCRRRIASCSARDSFGGADGCGFDRFCGGARCCGWERAPVPPLDADRFRAELGFVVAAAYAAGTTSPSCFHCSHALWSSTNASWSPPTLSGCSSRVRAFHAARTSATGADASTPSSARRFIFKRSVADAPFYCTFIISLTYDWKRLLSYYVVVTLEGHFGEVYMVHFFSPSRRFHCVHV